MTSQQFLVPWLTWDGLNRSTSPADDWWISRSHPPKNINPEVIPKSMCIKIDGWWTSNMGYHFCRDGWILKMVPTTHPAKIRENDHTCHLCAFCLIYTWARHYIIDFKGPQQRCLCLQQFRTFIFCLTEKGITLFMVVLSDSMKLKDCCLPWPPLLPVLARLQGFWSVAPGPSQPSLPPPFHRLRITVHRYDTMVCPQALRRKGWQGSQHPNIHEMNLSQVTWPSVREKCASSTKS